MLYLSVTSFLQSSFPLNYLGHLSAAAHVNNKILLFFFFKCYIVSLHLFLRTGGDFQRGVVGSGRRSVLKELSVEQSHS